jgi:hypothetical protein
MIFLLPLLAGRHFGSSNLIAQSKESARTGPAYYRWVEFLLIATES